MTDLQVLISKLEQAEEGSRELDAEIAIEVLSFGAAKLDGDAAEVYFKLPHPVHDKNEPGIKPGHYWIVERSGMSLQSAPYYTTSLDAKLPGENIEQVALHDFVEGEPLGTIWEAWHLDPDTHERTIGAGNTEPLARRLAALKAMADE